MYSILLVEDEKIELETLRDYVDWKKIGIDKVFTARGGRSALACISEFEPDIIITDIQMPGMSGTDLAQLVREEGRRCKIVFLTGYDRFEYAKTAIQVQAEEYLLKPFQVEEVETLVAKILRKIKRERQTQETEQLAMGRMIEQVCAGQTAADDSELWKKAEQMNFCLFGFYGISKEHERMIHAMPETIHSFTLESLYIVLLPASIPAADIVKSWLNRWTQDIRVIGRKTRTSFTQLREGCEMLLSCQDALFFGEKGAFLFAEDIERHPPEILAEPSAQSVERLLRAVTDGDEKQAVLHMKELLASFRSAGRENCIQAAYSLHLHLRNRLQEDGGGSIFEGTGRKILHSATCLALESAMTEYICSCCQLYQKGTSRQLVSWVKRYITDHYAELCSAENIANEVNLSPNYLRRKFKEATGQTILEYLTEVRLNKAAELLKTSTLKVKEISVRVGYENISYFTQLFSKEFGVTPNEYKKMV